MASGLLPVFASPVFWSVLRSKMMAAFLPRLLMKPLFNSGAIAMPWTPGRVGDGADQLARLGVDDVHLVAVRDEDAVARRIEQPGSPSLRSRRF